MLIVKVYNEDVTLINLFVETRTADPFCRSVTVFCSKPIAGFLVSIGLTAYASLQTIRYVVQGIIHAIVGDEADLSEVKKWVKAYSVTAAFHVANALTLGFLFYRIHCSDGYESD